MLHHRGMKESSHSKNSGGRPIGDLTKKVRKLKIGGKPLIVATHEDRVNAINASDTVRKDIAGFKVATRRTIDKNGYEISRIA